MPYFDISFRAMGTPCEIKCFAPSSNKAQQVFDLITTDVQRLESRYSRYREDSYLSEINRHAAQGQSLRVDPETAALLNYADTCYQQSSGLFDITSGKLRHLWKFDGNLPSPALIEQALCSIGWNKLEWNEPELAFPVSGMELDFGGIVKEYAADRAASLCLEAGIYHGIINLGGDVRVIGPQADGSPWRIGIRHPRKDGLLNTVHMSQGALASSGDYERYMLINGERYGHILNPKTGWPVKYMASVSVVADFCVIAGSASTIAMLQEENGPNWLKQLKLPYVWFNSAGEQHSEHIKLY